MTRATTLGRLGAGVVAIAALACHAPGPRVVPGVAPATGSAPAQAAVTAPVAAPAPAAQNPSPMQEHTRRHERLAQRDDDGVRVDITGVLPKAVELFIPRRVLGAPTADLDIHFMGATWVPRRAVAAMDRPVIVAATYLGAGSGVYARPFAADTLLYATLLDSIRARVAAVSGAPRIGRVFLSGWSAGYGAIREILRRPADVARVDGVLLIDGIHTSYLPEGKPVADGGAIDSAGLAPFAAFARLAMQGKKRFVITHSEIFPGTFASTTECTDWLLGALGLRRVPVLEWGPMGMQQLSESKSGRFEVLGFAGNTAPDHVDQFHGIGAFLERLLAP
ncbi:MAG: hypothetical protein HY084_13805 [Gemmatimonadetes bacterium]|nr:hypothetical protein [Gemmatimonadota bacterium]